MPGVPRSLPAPPPIHGCGRRGATGARPVVGPVLGVLGVLGVRVVVLLFAAVAVAAAGGVVAVALAVVVSIAPFGGLIVRSPSLSPAVAFPSATLLAVAAVRRFLFFLRRASLAAFAVLVAAAAAAAVPVGVGVHLSRTPFHEHVPRLSFSSRPSHPARVPAPVPVCPCH